jgi:hypothetical protein
MVSGWCAHCHQLKHIHVVGEHDGTRQKDWSPVAHQYISHVDCGSVVETEIESATNTTRYMCTRHGLVFVEDTKLLACPGARKVIR